MSASPWKYFSWEELTCRCGCGKVNMDDRFMQRVVTLRTALDVKLPVRSAYRCPDYNAKISRSKSRTGPHTTGRAIDLGISGAAAFEAFALFEQLGFRGIGLDQKSGIRYIHLDDLDGSDTQPRPWVWTY